jgi:triphosphoribosyl-dephospho-CoA synthase
MSARGEWIAQAYLDACLAELQSLKPGNVHVFADDGHAMTTADFEASARASAPVMAHADLSVGARIHESIRRTRDAVGCNTNLGIVLLCAPLAAAALTASDGSLRDTLRAVLAALDVADAEQAFAAIRLAQPAGLGESAEHDVRRPATVTLLAAMTTAAERDRIARQYATGFHDVFEFGIPRLTSGFARWNDLRWATTSTYLGFLAAFADSHIARKYGAGRAEAVRRDAQRLDAALLEQAEPADMTTALLKFDAMLKAEAVNPGTSADLTVASLFALRLETAVPQR